MRTWLAICLWGPVACACAQAVPEDGPLEDRVEKLEEENTQLRQRLEKLEVDAALSHEHELQIPPLADYAWRKGEFRIVPYGIGWLSIAYDTERTSPGPFVLFVNSEDVEGAPGFFVTARATRLGLDFSGPRIWGAASGGKIEVDFFGVGTTENRAGILLRHAYGEFRTTDWRFVGGQTTDLVSPLFPNVLNYMVARAAGNIGHRRAQARIERYVHYSDTRMLTLQSSINRTVVTDFPSGPTLEGHDAGWPIVMGRVAWTSGSRGPGDNPAVIGVSGHIGQEAVDFETPPVEEDRLFLTWSTNVDWHIPLTEGFGVRGEFFAGQALGSFLGGINQGIDDISREGIRSIGGWVEIWYSLTPCVHMHGGYGIDDPNRADLTFGRRVRNQFIFTNLVCDITDKFNVGLEVSWWETRFIGLAPGETVRIETVMKYNF